MNGTITDFIKHHYRHFNAAALIDAAEGYVKQHLDGGKGSTKPKRSRSWTRTYRNLPTSANAASRHIRSR